MTSKPAINKITPVAVGPLPRVFWSTYPLPFPEPEAPPCPALPSSISPPSAAARVGSTCAVGSGSPVSPTGAPGVPTGVLAPPAGPVGASVAAPPFVAVADGVDVAALVTEAVAEGAKVAVLVAVAVGCFVAVAVGVSVAVTVGVRVAVAVAVGVAVGRAGITVMLPFRRPGRLSPPSDRANSAFVIVIALVPVCLPLKNNFSKTPSPFTPGVANCVATSLKLPGRSSLFTTAKFESRSPNSHRARLRSPESYSTCTSNAFRLSAPVTRRWISRCPFTSTLDCAGSTASCSDKAVTSVCPWGLDLTSRLFGGPPRPATAAAWDGLYTEAVIKSVNTGKAMIVIVCISISSPV